MEQQRPILRAENLQATSLKLLTELLIDGEFAAAAEDEAKGDDAPEQRIS